VLRDALAAIVDRRCRHLSYARRLEAAIISAVPVRHLVLLQLALFLSSAESVFVSTLEASFRLPSLKPPVLTASALRS
jgi:hypothetical protein